MITLLIMINFLLLLFIAKKLITFLKNKLFEAFGKKKQIENAGCKLIHRATQNNSDTLAGIHLKWKIETIST